MLGCIFGFDSEQCWPLSAITPPYIMDSGKVQLRLHYFCTMWPSLFNRSLDFSVLSLSMLPQMLK